MSKERQEKLIKLLNLLFQSSAFLAFLLYIVETNIGNLQIGVEAEKFEPNSILLKTNVKNDNVFGKKINYAVVLISKHNKSICSLNDLIIANFPKKDIPRDCTLKALNEIVTQPTYRDSLAIIPLPFYYEEQVNIGNENMTYSTIIEKEKFEKGLYDVRFYIFYDNLRLWNRVTQDIIEID